MNHPQTIRAAARVARLEIGRTSDDLLPATVLLDYASASTELSRVPVAADSPLLYGALAALYEGVIWYNDELPAWYGNYCQAHEFAHYWLHHGSAHCESRDFTLAQDDEDLSATRRVTGYGKQERREREANLFALEFLLPGAALRQAFTVEKLALQDIARRVGLPAEMVAQQLTRALFLPPETDELRREEETLVPLDPSQSYAATITSGPLLVTAGPGTGKTQTLIGRLLYLLQERAVAPEHILALTFSHKAADEMRSRVAVVAPAEAARLTIMTFHSFGWELLRKYWEEAKLRADTELLDPIDALLWLESALPELQLEHYQHLPEPTLHLPALLNAISRAKDELAGPERYRELAALMAAAEEEDTRLAAAKAAEVAHVYQLYQTYLERAQKLDFGDLICRAVKLLQDCPQVREEVRQQYQEILVDEYQDVNRASARLLREVAGDGRNLWVVGDLRQSIYRWRGAAPANLHAFGEDFPGAQKLPLKVNYRSRPDIVSAYAGFAEEMAAHAIDDFADWQPNRRPDGPALEYELAANRSAEGQGLADTIKKRQTGGIPWRDQAVICRTHAQLSRLAAALGGAGVPTLYLGDLFGRGEVRDLLAWLELWAIGAGRALVRVAQFPEYGVPPAEVRKLLAFAVSRNLTMAETLARLEEIPTLSPAARAGLSLVAAHLGRCAETATPAPALNLYLYQVSTYLRPLLADETPGGRHKLLALAQFLSFAAGWSQRQVSLADAAGPRFLRYVRQMARYGADRALGQLPGAAEGLDAVRLLTVHAAKGLEFPVVYVPHLGAGVFPHKRQHDPCPPPPGLAAHSGDRHEEEEECLFFVAMSRARDILCLSRAASYNAGRKSNPSPFLKRLEGVLPRPLDGTLSWPGRDSAAVEIPPAAAIGPEARRRYHITQLERYLRCPRQFFYRDVYHLNAGQSDVAYQQFHLCVYQTLGWLPGARGATVADALAKLLEVWHEQGPAQHAYAPLYWEQAQRMIISATTRLNGSYSQLKTEQWEVGLTNGTVVFTPDCLEESAGALTVRRWRTGRPPKEDKGAPEIFALYRTAAQKLYPQHKVTLESHYLSTDETRPVTLSDKTAQTRLNKYDEALERINRQQFPAAPGDQCPNCPFYFICPA